MEEIDKFMKIAVVDVAAESGGAMSVLLDFIKYVESDYEFCRNNQWLIYTSKPIKVTKDNIKNIVVEKIKKSWLHRLLWEFFVAKREFEKMGVELVFSLQNAGFKKGKYKQIVYFHNVLLLEPKKRYSLIKPEERKYALYTRCIAPYTLNSLKNASKIIVQTNLVKQKILSCISDAVVEVVYPNVVFNVKYYDSAILPIKGIIYPTSAVPFKRVEEIIICVKKYYNWFVENNFLVLITIDVNENKYARKLARLSCDINDVIKFIGMQKKEDLFNIYKEFGVLMSSELETFSLPLVEAGYIGTPIIAASYQYVLERTQDINNVFLYHPGNILEMMNAIKEARHVRKPASNCILCNSNTWDDIDWEIADCS